MRPALVLACLVLAVPLSAGDAPPPSERELVQRVQQLRADPFFVAHRLFPQDGLNTRTAEAQMAYAEACREAQEAIRRELDTGTAAAMAEVLGEPDGPRLVTLTTACADHAVRTREIQRAPLAVASEVLGKPVRSVPGGLLLAAQLPGVAAGTAGRIQQIVREQQAELMKDAREEALGGQEEPSVRDRAAWSAWRTREAQVRRRLAAEREGEHLTEIKALLTGDQLAGLTRIQEAVERQATERDAARRELAAVFERVLGRDGLREAVQLVRARSIVRRGAEPEPVADEELWRYLHATTDPLDGARFWLGIEDEATLGRLRTLAVDREVALRAKQQELREQLAPVAIDAVAAVLPEADRGRYREACRILFAFERARLVADELWADAARLAGLGAGAFPADVTRIAYAVVADEPELAGKVNGVVRELNRQRWTKVSEELKRRGVDRKDPGYAAITAEVNDAVTAEIQGQQLAGIREVLPEAKAAILDNLVPAWQEIDAARQALAAEVAGQLAQAVGVDRLLGRHP